MLHAASSFIFGPSVDVARNALIARASKCSPPGLSSRYSLMCLCVGTLESDAEAEIEKIGLLLDELHRAFKPANIIILQGLV